jgi:serine/threonine-protein kinase RsbW
LEISDPIITPQIITRSFAGRYDSLAEIGEFIRAIAHKAGLGNFAAYTVEMAVDEACSNIIEHAYGGEDRGEISFTCKLNTQGLTIVLEDYGKPFEPEKIADPDVSADLDDRPTHGLGLYFIRQWMDEVDFEFKESKGNRLTLFKKRPDSKSKSNASKK